MARRGDAEARPSRGDAAAGDAQVVPTTDHDAGSSGGPDADTDTDTAAAPPPATEQAVATALDAAAVRRVWPEVLAAAKERKKRTAALLVSATVRAVEDDTLVLSIGTAPLARLLSEQSNTDVIAESLHAVLGVRWRIRCEHGDGATRAGAGPRRPRRPPPHRPPVAPPPVRRSTAPQDGEPLPPEPPDEEAPPDDEESMLAEAAAGLRPRAAAARSGGGRHRAAHLPAGGPGDRPALTAPRDT